MSEAEQNSQNQQEEEQPESISILHFAYETLKQYGFQSVISTFEDMISNQIGEENSSKLLFEILAKNNEDADSYTLALEAEDIKDKIEELNESLKKLSQQEVTNKEDWQMVIEIPYETKDDSLENLLNTDSVFCYLAAQSWIENYTQEDKPFLFHRTELETQLRINEENQSKHIAFIVLFFIGLIF